MKTPLMVLGAAAVLAACAPTQQTASASGQVARTCFLTNDIAGWSDGGAGKFNIRTTRGDVYQARMIPTCWDANSAQQISVIPRHSHRLCVGGEADLVVREHATGGPNRCRLDQVRKLTTAEVAELRPVDRP